MPISNSYPRRRGTAVVYMALIFTTLVGFVSLATDYARVQLTKSQLETACDAAGRYGTKWSGSGSSYVLTQANIVMAQNPVNGSTVTLQSGDVKVGYWNAASKTFTNGGSPTNAVKITASLTSAKGNAVPLLFGQLIGRSTCNVSASCVHSYVNHGEFIGFNQIVFKNHTNIYGYDPTTNPNPTSATATAMATIGSNGYIGDGANGNIQGNVTTGPSGTLDPGFIVSGSKTTIATPIPIPSDPAWSPSTNPGGVPQIYVHNTSGTLQAGTYWFTSLTINQPLKFNGVTTIYVNGNIDQNANIDAFQNIPSNLNIYVLGTRVWDCANNCDIKASIFAPRTTFTAYNNLDLYGTFVLGSFTGKNTCNLWLDTTQTRNTIVKLLQ